MEKVQAGSRAAYKLVCEVGRILAGHMASTDESIAQIVARLEEAGSDRDLDVFREKPMHECSFSVTRAANRQPLTHDKEPVRGMTLSLRKRVYMGCCDRAYCVSS